METDETITGNRLLDEFMDLWLQERGFSDSELNYHESWDSLMTVVEKIAETPNFYPQGIHKYLVNIIIDITGRCCTIKESCSLSYIPFIEEYEDTLIINTWLACVEFCEWYKQQ